MLEVSKSDLIDPYSTAHRTHASKVCRAASAVVEGHISTAMTEDVNNKQHHRELYDSESQPNPNPIT